MKTTFGRPSVLAPTMMVLTLSSTAFAEGVPITPGLWEIKTHNSMLGTDEVEQQCMRESVFDPVAVLGDEEGCEISNETITGTPSITTSPASTIRSAVAPKDISRLP